jgi:malate permease and related proteins
MDFHIHILSSMGSLLALFLLAMAFKRIGILSEDSGKLFSRLVTQVTLPALIFFSLVHSKVLWSEAELALVMLMVTLVCLLLGWLVAVWLKLDGSRKGAVILTSGFGTSSTLGLAFISQTFQGDPAAMTQAVIISSLGVQPALFTLGTSIAMHYGSGDSGHETPLQATRRYLKSPIFIAFFCGLIVSLLTSGQSYPPLDFILMPISVIAASNTFFVTIAVGLSLRLDGLKDMMMIGACVATIKLIIMPLLLWLSAPIVSPQEWQVEVLVLEGSMSSALLAVVFCSAYGCDEKLAAKLVFSTTVLMIITTPLLLAFIR